MIGEREASGIAENEKKPTVLIIDDQLFNVKVLDGLLKSEGFLTRSAYSGLDGESIAEIEQPDLILLDIMMPGRSGFETCTALKLNPATSHIPIVFLSALRDVSDKVKGLSIGAVDYITKPFFREEVLARVKLHINLNAAQRTIIERQAARLQQVREAQQTMLIQPEELPGARFAVKYVPVLEAGGDFYDVFEIAGEGTGYFVADVSGHDLGVSLTTSALKALIRQYGRRSISPVEAMAKMNSALSSILTGGMYITACYTRLDRDRQELTIVSAGHPPVIHVAASGLVECLEASGDILGVFPDVEMQPIRRKASCSDRFFLYTDGLIERFGAERSSRDDGIERLMAACRDTMPLHLERAVAAIAEQLAPPDHPLQDDILLLGVEV